MSQEIFNPFGERVDGLSAKERIDMERAQLYSLWSNGANINSNYYWDYQSWLRNAERQHSR
jgi:hypothetical protein